METKVIEFERYLAILYAGLHRENSEKEDICREISQNLYDKYNECLIKGYGLEKSIAHTMEAFEAPDVLAGMFNSEQEVAMGLYRAISIVKDRRVALAILVATILLAFVI